MLLNNQSLSPSKVWRYQISIIKCSYYNFQGFFHISQQISKISVFYYIPLSTYSITIKLTCLQQYYRSNTLLKLLFVKRKGSHSPPCWDEIANCLCNLNVMKNIYSSFSHGSEYLWYKLKLKVLFFSCFDYL